MWIPALRRFAVLLVTIGGGTFIVSTLLGLLLGDSLPRAIAIGFYLMGCFLLIGGFFFGNLGPVRPEGHTTDPTAMFRLSSRRLRWATREEHEETINTSAVFVSLGFVLIVLGAISDNRHHLF
jgi:hypothetical protein